MSKKIVKVQRPIEGDDDAWLFYAENHANTAIQEPTGDLRKEMGTAYKAYFQAKFTDGKWIIGKRVSDRGW